MIFGVLGFFGWKIWKDWETVSTLAWHFSLFNLSIFLILLPFPFFIDVVAWHLVTRALGKKISFSKNFEIWMLSNFARYLPGGIWQYPGRVLLLSKLGISKVSGVTCLVLEALFVIFVGLSLTLLVFVSGGLNLSFESARFMSLAGLLLIVLFLCISNQKLMTKTSRLFISLTGKGQEIKSIRIPFRWVPPLILAYFFVFLLPSIMLFIMARSTVTLTFDLLPIFVGAYAASWLIGYVTFFAPAGIGVREVTLAGFLSVYVPFSVAAVVVIGLRVALFISEALGFGLAVLLSKRRP